MAAPQRASREKIEFPPNTPVTLALRFAQGKLMAGQYGESMMFTTTDNRVAFVPVEVAGQIEAAGINVRENFTLTQKWDGHKDSTRTWEVAKLAPTPEAARPAASSPAVGQQRDGTFVVPPRRRVTRHPRNRHSARRTRPRTPPRVLCSCKRPMPWWMHMPSCWNAR
jgi:hypothetical protein